MLDEEGMVRWVICGPLGEGDFTKAQLLSLLYGLRDQGIGKRKMLSGR